MMHNNAFINQVVECDRRTQLILMESGWIPTRQVDISDHVQKLEAAGYTVFPVMRTFLSMFGDLYLEWTDFNPRSKQEFRNDLWLHPIDALARIGDEGLHDLEEFLDTVLCPLGLTDHANEILMMDDKGRVYSDFEPTIIQYGENGIQAINAIITRKRILVLRNGFGNAVHEWYGVD
jgi:hypothetical protein